MNFSVIAAFVCLTVATVHCAGENQCCVDQPAPITKVEKIRVDTRYRTDTKSQHYNTKCGTFGWRRCGRNRIYTVRASYKVDIYAKKTYPQPCRKYACCHGFTAVDNVCYANHELPTAVGHVADIKDSIAHLGNVDLKDVFGTIHEVVG